MLHRPKQVVKEFPFLLDNDLILINLHHSLIHPDGASCPGHTPCSTHSINSLLLLLDGSRQGGHGGQGLTNSVRSIDGHVVRDVVLGTRGRVRLGEGGRSSGELGEGGRR